MKVITRGMGDVMSDPRRLTADRRQECVSVKNHRGHDNHRVIGRHSSKKSVELAEDIARQLRSSRSSSQSVSLAWLLPRPLFIVAVPAKG